MSSAIASFCSTSRIETPRLRISSNRPATCSTIFGARPSVGSSIITNSGSPIRVRHRVSICCSPPERKPAWVSARSLSSGNNWYRSSMLQRPVAFDFFWPSSRFWRTVSVGKMSRFSGT